ncbi:chromate transporter [Paenibacillus silvae]|uniref:chromate transporter n=1 Tax=Paenibacillus silvae TaxID=1325358 RepID=UPI00119CA761|nr:MULTISPECIES: chromate transporter [Paenibacillus]MCK6073224.1 chromate transporter [Paenibacillus silvae]MCK6149300.1 chromate transporter [Paenibacillus silvae]MCK6267599.1 chromate transporter [Paenibacillus silvae]
MNLYPKINLQKLAQIFIVFFKLGPSTFGGGYAMVSAIEREIVEKKNWLTPSEMSDMVSIAGSAPGGVAVNSAAFVGYRLAGVLGAVTAVFAITLPTFFIVFVLSIFGMIFKDVPKVQAALRGVHAAVVALIIVAAFKMGRSSIMDIATLIIAGSCVALLLFTEIHSLVLILAGPLAGILIIQIKRAIGIAAPTEKERQIDKPDLNYPEYYI